MSEIEQKSSARRTPMMTQYLSFKEEYPDALLLFRMGDFYEMFFDDARLASKALDIALTSRDRNKKEGIPMAGIPHHALDSYLPKLVQQGFKVAICDQVEDARKAKGLVKRDVVRVVTPGTVTTPGMLSAAENCYILALVHGRKGRGRLLGVAFSDLSTGEFIACEFQGVQCEEDAEALLMKLRPKEILLPRGTLLEGRLGLLAQELGAPVSYSDADGFAKSPARRALLEQFEVVTLEGFGLGGMPWAERAAGGLLRYLEETQKQSLQHIRLLQVYDASDALVLDATSQANLELVQSLRDGGQSGSLLQVLHKTRTAMGSRLLRKWLLSPLVDLERIEERLDAVGLLRDSQILRAEIRETFDSVADLERLAGRVGLGRVRGRELRALRESLAALPRFGKLLKESPADLLQKLASEIDPLEEIFDLLQRAVSEEPPQLPRDGGLIREGYSPRLDELRALARDTRTELLRFEARERQMTGIPNLKVKHNKVFGFFIEVRKTQESKVPDRYIRKQTLVGSERYITEELAGFEERVSSAQEESLALEIELFEKLKATLAKATARLQSTAAALAVLDVLATLAEVAATQGYNRPKLHGGSAIRITDGRHAVVESLSDIDYVPSDCLMDAEKEQILLITGPNMAGKSTYMRQVALIVILAQMGSFVPAKEAHIGIVDRIFTRVGASDNLVRGLSTFMVEMSETANILNNCTDQSLILLDEIGRGTSTFDGLAIAWAVTEHLHGAKKTGPRTLFATHYHEITALDKELPRLINLHIAVHEWREQILFLRKIRPGPASQSYGIQVARLAGLPKKVVARARQVLDSLEQGQRGRLPVEPPVPMEQQLDLFADGKRDLLRDLSREKIDAMTPIEALNRLARYAQRSQELTL